jgi:CheY-like chemotaxis protein
MKKIKILLIEDDADDVELLQEAIQDNHVDCTVDVIMEGDKVMPYLKTIDSLPDIIVMDFNLPKLHGREILALIRSIPSFAHIPIMVLTTSASPHDIQYALEKGADRFITKPSTIQGFNATVNTIVSLTHPE